MASLINSAGATGTGSLTIQGPNTNSNQTITLPDATGTAVVAGANSAITAGTAQASTSGTSIDFTGIPSWVKRITVMFNGVSTNGTSNPQVQLGSGSPTTTGYVGYNARQGATSNVYVANSSGFILDGSNVAATTLTGNAVFTLLGSNTWICFGVTTNTASANESSTLAGSIALAGTLDRVRITTVNGTDTFDAGSINILYE